MTVGTQAAVLASLDVTMFIEFQIPAWESELTEDGFLLYIIPRILKFCYYITIIYALCSNVKVDFPIYLLFFWAVAIFEK